MILIAFGVCELYRRKILLSPQWHVLNIGKAVAIAVGGYVMLQYFTKSTILLEYRSVTITWGLLLFLLLVLHRVFLFPALLRWFSRSGLQRRVVVLGASEVGVEFARQCVAGTRYGGLQVVGFLDDTLPDGQAVLPPLKCLGETASLSEIVDLYRIEGCVITATGLSYQRLMDLVEQSVRLFGWVDVHSDRATCLHENLAVDTFLDIPVARMGAVRNDVLVRAYKRVGDVLAAAVGLVVLSPVLLAAAVAVKVSSKGPVMFVTERIGYKGEKFRFYKFRSMRQGADRDEKRAAEVAAFIQNDETPGAGKCVNEDYVTPVGRFIRKWAIDELPQLWNVLRGDMSLVGPRPSPIAEFMVNDEWHKRRFEIKPGCTGLWKLFASGEGRVTFSQTVLYDIYYARNMNPLLDLYILIGTVRVILAGRADV